MWLVTAVANGAAGLVEVLPVANDAPSLVEVSAHRAVSLSLLRLGWCWFWCAVNGGASHLEWAPVNDGTAPNGADRGRDPRKSVLVWRRVRCC